MPSFSRDLGYREKPNLDQGVEFEVHGMRLAQDLDGDKGSTGGGII